MTSSKRQIKDERGTTMNLFKAYERKKSVFREGVAHATFDPNGPGSVRLHLIPPKPSFWSDPPSLLIINGFYFLPVGPAWATILRIFFDELTMFCPVNREINPEEIERIEDSTVIKVKHHYPKTEKERILNDLREIVTLAISIAQDKAIPEEVEKGMTLDQFAKHMTAPHRMDLIVAPMSVKGQRLCQLDCACCYAACQKVMDIEDQLPTEDWKEIIYRCKEAGIPMLTFTGGEPLTRPDIVELVKHAKWFVTRINTNGYSLTKKLAGNLLQASLDGIQITLYSYDSEIHDLLVGKKGAWERTVEGIKNALAVGLGVAVNTPLMEKNRDYSNTLRFLNNLGVHCVSCSGLIPTGGAEEQMAIGNALTKAELKNVLVEAMIVRAELKMDLSFTSPGWLTSEEIHQIGLPTQPVCGACLSNMAIAPNGEVIPCQSWLNGLTLGNMLTDKWSKIWNHYMCQQIRFKKANKSDCALKEV
jgi:MoaA/NifB/PqqE/SkfB family radical SAM enzyme